MKQPHVNAVRDFAAAVRGILSILTIALSMNDAMPRYGILIGPVTAAYIYQLEKRPFHKALTEGAVRARWWFPAVWLLGVMVLLFVVELAVTGRREDWVTWSVGRLTSTYDIRHVTRDV